VSGREKVISDAGQVRSYQGNSDERPLLFAREDFSLYCSLATLPQRAGVPARHLAKLVAKEFTDNALDSADAAGRPGAVTIELDDDGNLIVTDQGAGIPDANSPRNRGKSNRQRYKRPPHISMTLLDGFEVGRKGRKRIASGFSEGFDIVEARRDEQ
jgi:hypothetical protein